MKAIAPPKDPAAAPPDKPKRIAAKVRLAIAKLIAGDCKKVTDAAILVGLSREHLSRQLNKPYIAEFMRQEVLRSLSVAATRAGSTKIELLDSDNEIVRDRASSFILGVIGIKPETTPGIPQTGPQPGVIIQIIQPAADPKLINPDPFSIEQPQIIIPAGH